MAMLVVVLGVGVFIGLEATDDADRAMRSSAKNYHRLTNGLWDAINTYDYEAYVSYFPLLQNSDGYLQTMMRMRSSRETLESLMNSGETFVDLDSGDEKIQMISYLFRLLRY